MQFLLYSTLQVGSNCDWELVLSQLTATMSTVSNRCNQTSSSLSLSPSTSSITISMSSISSISISKVHQPFCWTTVLSSTTEEELEPTTRIDAEVSTAWALIYLLLLLLFQKICATKWNSLMMTVQFQVYDWSYWYNVVKLKIKCVPTAHVLLTISTSSCVICNRHQCLSRFSPNLHHYHFHHQHHHHHHQYLFWRHHQVTRIQPYLLILGPSVAAPNQLGLKIRYAGIPRFGLSKY